MIHTGAADGYRRWQAIAIFFLTCPFSAPGTLFGDAAISQVEHDSLFLVLAFEQSRRYKLEMLTMTGGVVRA